MADQLIFKGWAFSWYSHTCQDISKLNPNLDTLPYSMDFQTVKEIIYDEWADYCFQFKVDTTYDRSIIKAEMNMPDNKQIFLSDSPEGFKDPRMTYNEFSPKQTSVRLFWPVKIKTDHAQGSYKIKINLGWKESPQAGLEPKWLPQSSPPIQIEIVDVIPDNP